MLHTVLTRFTLAIIAILLSITSAFADKYIVTANELNVRKWASSDSYTPIVEKLKKGDIVDAKPSHDPEWLEINLSVGSGTHNLGYVFAKFLEKDKSHLRNDNFALLPKRSLPFLENYFKYANNEGYQRQITYFARISENGRYAFFLKNSSSFIIYDIKLERIIYEDNVGFRDFAVTNNFLLFKKNGINYSYKLNAGSVLERSNIPHSSDFASVADSDKVVTYQNLFDKDAILSVYDLKKEKIEKSMRIPKSNGTTHELFNSKGNKSLILSSGFPNGDTNNQIEYTDGYLIDLKSMNINFSFDSYELSLILKDIRYLENVHVNNFSDKVLVIGRDDDNNTIILSFDAQTKSIIWRKSFHTNRRLKVEKINEKEGYFDVSFISPTDRSTWVRQQFNLFSGTKITQNNFKNGWLRKITWTSNSGRNSLSISNNYNKNSGVYLYNLESWVGFKNKKVLLPFYSSNFVDMTENNKFRSLISDATANTNYLYEWKLDSTFPTLILNYPQFVRWVSAESSSQLRTVLTGVSRKKVGRYAAVTTKRLNPDGLVHELPIEPSYKAGNTSFENCFESDVRTGFFKPLSIAGTHLVTGEGCVILAPEGKNTDRVTLHNIHTVGKSKHNFGTISRVNGKQPQLVKNDCVTEKNSGGCAIYFNTNHDEIYSEIHKRNLNFGYNESGEAVFEVLGYVNNEYKSIHSFFAKELLSNKEISGIQTGKLGNFTFYLISHNENSIEFLYEFLSENQVAYKNYVRYNYVNRKKYYINNLNITYINKVFRHKKRLFIKNNINGIDKLFVYNENFEFLFNIDDLETTGKYQKITLSNNKLVNSISPTEHRIFSLNDGKLDATFFIDGEGNAVAMTPSGFFSENKPGAASSIIVQNKDTGEALPLSSVFDDLYRPDLVQEALRGDPDGKVKEATKKLNLASVVGSGAAPEIQKVEFEGDPNSSSITAKYEAVTQDGGAGQVIWRMNGVVVGVEDFASNANSGEIIQGKRRVPLVKGENVVSVQITNSKQSVYSNEVSDTIVADPQKDVKPQLFVLALGVNEYQAEELKLNFSVPDALAIVDSLAKKSDQYDEVIVHKLLDGEVTKEAIADKFAEISEAIEPDDTFVFYLAGHGITHEGKFYFLPADVNVEDGFESAIQKYGVSQNDWRSYLSGISALKSLVLFDACESGSAIRLDASHALEQSGSIDRLARASGRAIITASSETQYALEGYEGHGAFTYTLLQAFENGDDNSDNQLQLSEIAKYVKRELPKITEEKWDYKQEPQVALSGADFPLAQVGR